MSFVPSHDRRFDADYVCLKRTSTRGMARMVYLILIVGVLVPTACVLLFMVDAMRNSQLAIRQQLTDWCRQQLMITQTLMQQQEQARLALVEKSQDEPAPVRFASLAREGITVVIDDAEGRRLYPRQLAAAEPARPREPEWLHAETAENAAQLDGSWKQAADAWLGVSRQISQGNHAGAAQFAAARCLSRAGDHPGAIRLYQSVRETESRDEFGRLLAPMASLRILEIMSDEDPARLAEFNQLKRMLANYKTVEMPSSQRLFMLQEYRRRFGSDDELLRLEQAEEKAACWLLSADHAEGLSPAPSAQRNADIIAMPAAALNGWRIRMIVMPGELEQLFKRNVGPRMAGIRMTLLPPGMLLPIENELIRMDAGNMFPGWRMAAGISGNDPFAPAISRSRLIYLSAGAIGVTTILCVGIIMAGFVGRQMRLTRLKNDLIATVSHELKTPLAGMRVLVDTMLEGRCTSSQQQHEYLQMIARENLRLSRLIENFLTFSRMERQKKLTGQELVHVEDLIHAAIERVGLMHNGADCGHALRDLITQEVEPNLLVRGESESLATVVSNLIDNAIKYSREDKHIAINARQEAGQVIIEVKDHGIGISPRHQKKIFQRFWQVDRRLSRDAGGCGLGLAIVTYILEQHGGKISVQSAPGVGSTFTVRLPAADAGASS